MNAYHGAESSMEKGPRSISVFVTEVAAAAVTTVKVGVMGR
jgi:hypothetical protein